MNSSLILGTAQFGLDYGVTNLKGRVPEREVFAILDLARRYRITLLDTAFLYGDSEEVLGRYIRSRGPYFDFISKFPALESRRDLETVCRTSLDRLGMERLYAYLLHDFSALKKNLRLWDWMNVLKEKNLVEKIGFSLYHPEEWLFLKERACIPEVLQFPLSLVDRRFAPFLKEMKSFGIEIHVRSVFLQGLAFVNPLRLPNGFERLREVLMEVEDFGRECSFSKVSIWLSYPLGLPEVDAFVVGVTSANELYEILQAIEGAQKIAEKVKRKKWEIVEENIILPYKWPEMKPETLI